MSNVDAPEGEPCMFANDCVEGTNCAPGPASPICNAEACCVAFCDLSDPTCSIAGTECTTFYARGTAPSGYENVGVCVNPDGWGPQSP